MFGGSSGELALIFLLALLVFGPERLPGLAHNLGKLVRRSRLLLQSVWNELEDEIDRGEKTRQHRAAAAGLVETRVSEPSSGDTASSAKKGPDDDAPP